MAGRQRPFQIRIRPPLTAAIRQQPPVRVSNWVSNIAGRGSTIDRFPLAPNLDFIAREEEIREAVSAPSANRPSTPLEHFNRPRLTDRLDHGARTPSLKHQVNGSVANSQSAQTDEVQPEGKPWVNEVQAAMACIWRESQD